jgi:type II secretory pathway component PulF
MDPQPPDAPRPSVAVTAVIVAIAVLLWLAVIGELVFVVPIFEKTLADFKVRLPYSTEVVIAMSRWCVKYFYVLAMPYTVLAVCVAGATWAIRHLARKPKLALAWSALMLLAPALVALLIVLFCYLPYAALLEGLQK